MAFRYFAFSTFPLLLFVDEVFIIELPSWYRSFHQPFSFQFALFFYELYRLGHHVQQSHEF